MDFVIENGNFKRKPQEALMEGKIPDSALLKFYTKPEDQEKMRALCTQKNLQDCCETLGVFFGARNLYFH